MCPHWDPTIAPIAYRQGASCSDRYQTCQDAVAHAGNVLRLKEQQMEVNPEMKVPPVIIHYKIGGYPEISK